MDENIKFLLALLVLFSLSSGVAMFYVGRACGRAFGVREGRLNEHSTVWVRRKPYTVEKEAVQRGYARWRGLFYDFEWEELPNGPCKQCKKCKELAAKEHQIRMNSSKAMEGAFEAGVESGKMTAKLAQPDPTLREYKYPPDPFDFSD